VKVCVVGSGGREHAYATALAATADVVTAPGSPGIEGSTSEPVESIDADLYVIGPEVPLVDGLADRLRAAGKVVFGPGADGARLEGSKRWMKDLVASAGVPTARYGTFDASELDAALGFLATMVPPYVIKTDGLAAGKGVLVTADHTEAAADVRDKLAGTSFGDAGRRVVIEEGLVGPEASVFALCDGERAVLIPTAAQDHKRVGDGDTGPNTGGMGCYSPMPGLDLADLESLMDAAVHPTMRELQRRGIDYRGVLYAGFMLTVDGPKLLEYNVRFGDPEAQVILPRLEGDFADVLYQAATGRLTAVLELSSDAMVTVVCASEGYPTAPRTGDVIDGLDEARSMPGVSVFCAGVGADDTGRLVTAGGRVLNVCGRGTDLATARRRAYEAVARISWPGMHYRTDIASLAEEGSI
jgi:phosphoribosylamine---glycine ligase